jgi:hypothetical protein
VLCPNIDTVVAVNEIENMTNSIANNWNSAIIVSKDTTLRIG